MSDRSHTDALEAATMRQVALRILPFLMFCYFISFLDRVNLGFAALQMIGDLHLSASTFGLGGGLFFVTYFFCEVPSNLLLEKIGARRWIARIMITWGFLAGGMALVKGSHSFYAMRLLLGAAEAGFFPGVILYLSYWFPARLRWQFLCPVFWDRQSRRLCSKSTDGSGCAAGSGCSFSRPLPQF